MPQQKSCAVALLSASAFVVHYRAQGQIYTRDIVSLSGLDDTFRFRSGSAQRTCEEIAAQKLRASRIDAVVASHFLD